MTLSLPHKLVSFIFCFFVLIANLNVTTTSFRKQHLEGRGGGRHGDAARRRVPLHARLPGRPPGQGVQSDRLAGDDGPARLEALQLGRLERLEEELLRPTMPPDQSALCIVRPIGKRLYPSLSLPSYTCGFM